MLYDSRIFVKELALRRIMKAKSNNNNLRIFTLPKLNFEADDYIDLISWTENDITCPPILQHMSIEDIKDVISDPETNFSFVPYPCHTQAVERCVKLVTEASGSVVGSDRRDGFIKARIHSRKAMPQFETKKDFIQ